MTDRAAIFKRSIEGFIPANNDAQEFFSKTKLGQLVTMECKRPRSLAHHRLFFAILRMISDNSNPHISEAAALHFAKLATGTGDMVTDSRGEQHFIPGSISFASMDEAAFDEFIHAAIPPIVGRFMVGTAPQDVIDEAMSLAR